MAGWNGPYEGDRPTRRTMTREPPECTLGEIDHDEGVATVGEPLVEWAKRPSRDRQPPSARARGGVADRRGRTSHARDHQPGHAPRGPRPSGPGANEEVARAPRGNDAED